ncbi:SDR family oxidoreductase [Frankia sp. AgB1.9]|uniref:SDR family NAD(P)-dependent oxidoreductase n=1 Tax=unclassified Frankia TaxID=2632575 RepID=UPI00193127E3|nr:MULTISPECIES: SDR family oxidoreductase [unclassified Frankia]MBL7489670.1 SDR family oxidoreductase [Frankia sp. AgW1.1]MBL7550735.1 SDR family oxidoreductase [Frankia sp. AgB1.9]MBL7624352.1 SDR family oxidoreductase [Frankia sp. AgB1.8]
MTAFRLDDRHVVVTGASRGLGRAIAHAIAAAGAFVTLVARSEAQLTETKTKIEASGGAARVRAADLSTLDAAAELARDLTTRPVHGVVHAAGITHRADAQDFDDEALRRVLTVNLHVPIALARELTRHRVGSTPCSHVFIGSLGSSIAIPRAIAYTASKAGILGVVRSLATEWAALGIRVNAISPGYFRTDLTADLLDQAAELARIEQRIPMRRLGRPEELGGAAVFLLSDASSYVTGQQIIVDGGWLAN